MVYCSISGCGRPHYGLGWCRLHYRRYKASGDPNIVVPRGGVKTRGSCSIPGCDAPHYGHGLCIKHAARARRRGDPRAEPLKDMTLRDATKGLPPLERFAARLTASPGWLGLLGGCWEWRGSSTGAKDYGLFAALEPTTGERITHRAAYVLARGPIPAGLQLDHLCRNPPCCNPWHLEPVTNAENGYRGESPMAQNRRKTHCRNGHPLDGDNMRPERGSARRCKACAVEANRRYRERRRLPR